MPTFRKQILSSGSFIVPSGGGSKKIQLTPERLKKWAGTFEAMRKAGLEIPGPWSHATKLGPVQMGQANRGGIVEDAAKNAGFWTKVWYDEAAKALMGEIEAPGNVSDPNTPAGKLASTVKETSVYVAPSWQDGIGRIWDEPIMHIGCVVHPIEPGQPNFEPVGNEMVIAMSFQTEDDPNAEVPPEGDEEEEEPDPLIGGGLPAESSSNMQNVIGLLSAVGIVLPPTTTPENFLPYLEIALGQYQACCGEGEETDGTITNPPEGASEKQAPFIMAFSNDQLAAIAAANVVNPATKKPFTLAELQETAKVAIDHSALTAEVVMAHPTVQNLVKTVDSVTNAITETARNNYRGRTARLVAAKAITQEFADASLKPLIDSVVMSFANGKPVETTVDILLKGFESGVKNIPFSANSPGFDAFLAMSHGGLNPDGTPAGSSVADQLPHPLTDSGAGEMTPEQVQAKLKSWKELGYYN